VPSITVLMSEFGIARNTEQGDIEVLKDEGLVIVRQGRGTFVARLVSVWREHGSTGGVLQLSDSPLLTLLGVYPETEPGE